MDGFIAMPLSVFGGGKIRDIMWKYAWLPEMKRRNSQSWDLDMWDDYSAVVKPGRYSLGVHCLADLNNRLKVEMLGKPAAAFSLRKFK